MLMNDHEDQSPNSVLFFEQVNELAIYLGIQTKDPDRGISPEWKCNSRISRSNDEDYKKINYYEPRRRSSSSGATYFRLRSPSRVRDIAYHIRRGCLGVVVDIGERTQSNRGHADTGRKAAVGRYLLRWHLGRLYADF